MENNIVYKGYRLSAIVKREAASNQPAFTATLLVIRHEGSVSSEHGVPQFAQGGAVPTPRRAVDAAILHGRQLVDEMNQLPVG
ncbi:hypothetical protein CAL12_04510 [Bordetella genomosp. 8]|uniref:Uncharacterized protein n=1 Tax=Bordetella genomosp. 8 TaxID=1416806 RepID=A0A1W6YHZ6_9BORD|nr:hypothetical protein [Bordetella genomosp. 8]ARP80163.1 hypothetical protein CAL12_04510 [Bordetella genomosp. 8]